MNNIFNNNEGFEDVVSKNRYGIRTLQAKYLQNQYEKMQNAKKAEKMAQQMQKDVQMQMLKKLNENYLNQVSQNHKKKLRERQSLSMEYDDFIKNHQQKGKIGRIIEKNIQRSSLEAPTWIRDVFTERDTYKKNMQHYSKALADHVKLQEMRKQMQKSEEHYQKRKIDQQANAIIKKDMLELESRHRQKSMFQQRQNQLLGVKSQNKSQNPAMNLQAPEHVFRRREQDLYSQGLQIQLRKEQQKRFVSQDKMSNSVNSNIYNPITNPIPFIYKNPNVLRTMMSQN